MKSLSIRVKFIFAFMAAVLVAIGLVGVFTSISSKQQFQSFIEESLIDKYSEIVISYYENYQTLAGINSILRPGTGSIPPEFRELNRTGIVLVLPNGQILVGDETHQIGSFVSVNTLQKAESIEVEDTVIGYLVIYSPQFQHNPQEEEFIERTNTALVYASLIAIILAIILGLIFTRTLLRPLSNLNTAIGKMEKGELLQEVPKTSNDELGDVIEGFNQMSNALAKANAQREQMTADIAHELRSPLTVINGYLEALEDGVLEFTPERLGIIQQEVSQLNRLVSDLRTLALADAGQLSIIKDRVNLQTLFNHLQKAYDLIVTEKKIELTFKKDEELEYIYADEGRILQVLSNLITNSVRHTDQGGDIFIDAYQLEENTVIEVRDTGEGIPEEELDLVFERFYRSDPSRQTTSSQSGLGLSIVRAIVETHGGKVTVDSKVNEGSIFSIILPNE